jgi:hypothetical protein
MPAYLSRNHAVDVFVRAHDGGRKTFRGGFRRPFFSNLRIRTAEGSMVRRILITTFVSLAILTGGSSIVNAEPGNSPEYLIKAAYLYNFMKFVEWPPEAFRDRLSPIDLYILGTDPFGEVLGSISDKVIKGRRLRIKHVNRVDQISGGHILFISASEKENLRHTLRAVRNSAILTVSEMNGFAQQGGIINFITVENKIQFEINPDAAQQSRLKIGSQLLRLAKIVAAESRRENE